MCIVKAVQKKEHGGNKGEKISACYRKGLYAVGTEINRNMWFIDRREGEREGITTVGGSL